MTQKDHLRLTREELYSLVWAKPVTEVGTDFQLSGRAVAKICARKQVPVPPRGYWAKRSAGKVAPKPLLPKFVAKPFTERKNRVGPERKVSEKPKFRSLFEERSQTIKKALKEFRKPLSEAVDYKVRIDEWHCDYSFGLNPSFNPLHRDTGASFLYEEPYSEYRDLVLRGVFLEPARLKQRKFEARFAREPYLDKEMIEANLHRYEESPPKSVGTFLRQNLSVMAYLSLPDDAFALVLQNASAHKINFMTLRGQNLRYGRGDIYRYSLQEEQDE